MDTQMAPDFTPGYPSKGRKLGPAWSALWAKLVEASRTQDPYLDGRELASEVAPDYGLADSTLVALLSRAAKAGHLSGTGRPVTTDRGTRVRTFYRANEVDR